MRILGVDVGARRQQRFHTPRVALTRRVVQRCASGRAARTKRGAGMFDRPSTKKGRKWRRRIPGSMAATTQFKVAAFGTSEPLDSAGIRAELIAPIAMSIGGILTRLLEAVSTTCLNERPRHPARFSSKVVKEYSEASDARRVGLSDDGAEEDATNRSAFTNNLGVVGVPRHVGYHVKIYHCLGINYYRARSTY